MAFKDLPEHARPREKLIARGAAALADTELLALLLRTGVAGKNVLQLAQELHERFLPIDYEPGYWVTLNDE